MEQPGIVAGNFALSFSFNFFWAFLCISQAPSGWSLWSRHHWKDLFLLQKLSIDGHGRHRSQWVNHAKRRLLTFCLWTTSNPSLKLKLLTCNPCFPFRPGKPTGPGLPWEKKNRMIEISTKNNTCKMLGLKLVDLTFQSWTIRSPRSHNSREDERNNVARPST